MTKIFTLLLLASLSGGSIGATPTGCPTQQPGPPPWTNNGAVAGDEWAWVYLKLDAHGWPIGCVIGANDIEDPVRRFLVCKFMMESWHPASKEERRSLASTTAKRFFMIAGPDHKKKMRQARERYFAENPDVRRECFPEE